MLAHDRPAHVAAFTSSQDFSVVLGGPLYQLLRRAHLSGDALELLRQRLLVIPALAWTPLLALSMLERHVWGGGARLSFLWDVEAHVRFLVALPLLVAAELVVHVRMRSIVRQFLERHLITAAAMPRFEAAVASAIRLRNSVVAEAVLLAFVYAVGILLVWRRYVALPGTATWYATPGPEGITVSLTGMWYVFVSLPLFQFLLVRWYYRVFIWSRFLWHVSRLELSLVPTHPDRVGGLGFVTNVAYAFVPLTLAHGATVAGTMANRIFYAGATLTSFRMDLLLLVTFLLVLVLGPFVVFVPQLAAAKRTGLREYGTLAERYTRAFEEKWLRGGAPAGESLVGSGDIQSLADMANSYDVVKTMRLAPITRAAVLPVIAAALVPVAPLLLTTMSLDDLVRKLINLLL